MKSCASPEFIARLEPERAFWNNQCDGTVDYFDVPVCDDSDMFILVLRDIEVPVEDKSVDCGAVAVRAQTVGYNGLLRRVCDVESPKSDMLVLFYSAGGEEECETAV